MAINSNRGSSRQGETSSEELERYNTAASQFQFDDKTPSSMRRLLRQLQKATDKTKLRSEQILRENPTQNIQYADQDEHKQDNSLTELSINKRNKVNEMLQLATNILDGIFSDNHNSLGLIYLDNDEHGNAFDKAKIAINQNINKLSENYNEFFENNSGCSYSTLLKATLALIALTLIFSKFALIIGLACTAVYIYNQIQPPLDKALKDIVELNELIEIEDKKEREDPQNYHLPFFSKLNMKNMAATAGEKLDEITEKASSVLSFIPGFGR